MTEDRQKIWNEYQGPKPPTIRHNFLDYDRYFEAKLIADELQGMGVDLSKIVAVDFGCCAGDYGMYFARLGSKVWFVDIDHDALDFVNYRTNKEDLIATLNLYLPTDELFDLAIFGEVLEHCDDAFELLLGRVRSRTSFIFTSSYPYRNDEKTDSYWMGRGHSNQARVDQPLCRTLLETYYNKINYGGERNLWIRKKDEEL